MIKKEFTTLNYYDGISKGYSNLYHEEQKIKISKIINYLPKQGVILDLGAGDGVLNQFLDQFKLIKLISFDLSFQLLKLNTNNNKIQGTAQALPFKNKKFDTIISFTMLQDAPEPVKVLEEIKRVLKTNGTIILSFLKLSSKLDEILDSIKNNFNIIKEIEEEKDYIFILK